MASRRWQTSVGVGAAHLRDTSRASAVVAVRCRGQEENVHPTQPHILESATSGSHCKVFLRGHFPLARVQPHATSAAEPPRRALNDITNISPLRLPTPPRRTVSTPGERPQHSHLFPLERYAVAVLTLDGQKQKDVAVKVGCSPRAVRTWSQRIGEDEDAEDSQRSGRPKLLHPSTMDALIDAAIAAPKASTPRELKHKFDLSCSVKTIRRVLDDAGLFGRIARVIPPQNARITQLRLSFGQGYADFDWKKVLWSDEMFIRIGPQGQTWVQRPIGEAFDPQYCVEKEKHAPKVHVWGCMSAAGVGAIHVFTENLDAALMKKILKEHPPTSFGRQVCGISSKTTIQSTRAGW